MISDRQRERLERYAAFCRGKADQHEDAAKEYRRKANDAEILVEVTRQ